MAASIALLWRVVKISSSKVSSRTRSSRGARSPRTGLLRTLVLVSGCSGQATSTLPSNAPTVDVVTPPPGVADRGDDPAVVAIDGLDAPGAPPCAGVLVAPDVVLTARHCVSLSVGPIACPSEDAGAPPPLRTPASLRVLVGDDVSTAAPRARGRGILVPAASSMCGADIALLLLDVPIDDIEPLVVRPTGAAQGDHLRAVGWRLPVRGGSAPKILRDHLLVLDASPTELELAEGPIGGGGPVLSETTAEVLGVFSRSGDDPSRAVYTRSDAFVALVGSALAESDSALVSVRGLEKPKKGAVDLGANCVAGGDCAAGVCVSVSAGPGAAPGGPPVLDRYCSRTCGSRDRCPAGFRCQRSQGGLEVCTES